MKGKKTILTPEQEAWLVANYADTSNAECSRVIGIPWRTMRRIAAELGLEKSEEYMHATQVNAAAFASKANRGIGNAGIVNLQKYGARYQFGKGRNPKEEMTDEQWREMVARRGRTLSETYRKERRRILFGLEQRTRLRVCMNQNRSLYNLRSRLRRAGYEIKRASNVVIITAETRRSDTLERRAERYNLKLIKS